MSRRPSLQFCNRQLASQESLHHSHLPLPPPVQPPPHHLHPVHLPLRCLGRAQLPVPDRHLLPPPEQVHWVAPTGTDQRELHSANRDSLCPGIISTNEGRDR